MYQENFKETLERVIQTTLQEKLDSCLDELKAACKERDELKAVCEERFNNGEVRIVLNYEQII